MRPTMRLLIPLLPVALFLEHDELGPMWGVTFSVEDGLQIHFGERSLIVCR
jgi:hypothetical protein